MKRFDQFLLLLQAALTCGSNELNGVQVIAALAAVFNPNVTTNINQGSGAGRSVEVMASAYYRYVTHDGPKPEWFVTGDE